MLCFRHDLSSKEMAENQVPSTFGKSFLKKIFCLPKYTMSVKESGKVAIDFEPLKGNCGLDKMV